MEPLPVYLTDLTPTQVRVGYGQLGLHGSLGYENKAVRVADRSYSHALSAHPPSRVRFPLGGRYGALRCHVALNDDVPPGRSSADFSVFADGRLVAVVPQVLAGAPPRELVADVRGANTLELEIRTSRWEFCHAVWLDPVLDEAPPARAAERLLDCLGRAEITLPRVAPSARRCIATVVSPGYTELLDDMLGSLYAHGGCQDALLVVFALDADAECVRVAGKYGATLVPCRSHARINATSKALLYTVARVVDAERYLCLDADMLVLGDLRPIFAALEAAPSGSILVCREGNSRGLANLGQAFRDAYWGNANDLKALKITGAELAYPLAVNDGLFAAERSAMLALDGFIRELPGAVAWVDQRRDNWWRNQFIFNLALARLDCAVELDPTWNLQLHAQDVEWADRDGRARAEWHGRPVRVLHFSGVGRRKYPEQRNKFVRVSDPLTGGGGGDPYAAFLDALRAWIGRFGLASLAWSFYGVTDATTARVADPSTFPLLALLHYLVRTNGCVRVLETGTARGISAACLASAVAHRAEGRVVTLDPYRHAERSEMWKMLPESIRRCIEERTVGSLEGMAAALEAGERYEAALLDSIHTEEHVWAEFELASRLVCPGGLILIHDAIYAHGTVGKALLRIQAAGYDVTRLWTAESGIHEDDRLGLAVIENRRTREAATPS
ncbi:CmcI family methyltransferase [Sorangium sp. So ce426]|uniref:CmcI family methyltransferase n=1 Tax=Sorangium sp. So ce426 TaxID=3133312 RepID=UPI003F5B4401